MSGVRRIYQLSPKDRRHSWYPGLYFCTQLYHIRVLETTEARDKVYGLTGSADLTGQTFVPDCEKAIWHVYAEITRAALLDTVWAKLHAESADDRHMDWLGWVDSPTVQRRADLPS